MEKHWDDKEWNVTRDQLTLYLDWFEGFDNVAFAAVQGAANFVPSMLPNLWRHHPCPYQTPVYKEAWYRGFYSAAAWFLIHNVVQIVQAFNPMADMIDWYASHTSKSDLIRVPGGLAR